ncbi:hypothetical protein [Metabacillus halosaccharovorans]|uniref:Uncharacterized protein n=1 Tax=Metabacillus halosaccharovorans TaxID=930124 RepID=A0ABT3DIB5_9BACI|nr:hypothetical protein [Metabacillus halosaccharovorans]MCV9886251.1 hypothetical protein [Metabacillus halosaccharovorans]
MKPTIQMECYNEYCKSIVLTDKHKDGISCPRCRGPLMAQPFIEKHKPKDHEALSAKQVEMLSRFIDNYHKYGMQICSCDIERLFEMKNDK